MPAFASHCDEFPLASTARPGYWTTYSVSREHLKQAQNFSKEVHRLLTRSIASITTRAQSRNTGSVSLPLMIPECLITLVVRNPVRTASCIAIVVTNLLALPISPPPREKKKLAASRPCSK
jgi:hypothetical protein